MIGLCVLTDNEGELKFLQAGKKRGSPGGRTFGPRRQVLGADDAGTDFCQQ